jgi:hypothetical protein
MKSMIVMEDSYGETIIDLTAQVPMTQHVDHGQTDRLIVYFGNTNFKDHPVIMLVLSSRQKAFYICHNLISYQIAYAYLQ